MKDRKKMYILIYIIALIPLLISAVFYGKLPDLVPTNWSIDGPVSYGSKTTLFGLSALAPIAVFLMQFGALMNPQKRELRKSQLLYPALALVLALFINATVAMSISESLNPGRTTSSALVILCVGLLLVFFGVVMPQAKYRAPLGIKTPWTLANAAVWEQTHQASSLFWFVGGLIVAVESLIVTNNQIMGGIALVVLIVLILLSVLMSRKFFLALPASERNAKP